MPIGTSLVGSRSPTLTAAVDRRWTMAYACGLGDHNPLYLDSEANEHTLAHPMFPVCLEWPVLVAMRASAKLEEGERLRAVHASHDSHLHHQRTRRLCESNPRRRHTDHSPGHGG